MITEVCAIAGCDARTLAHWTTCRAHYRDGMNVEDARRIEENLRRRAQARHAELVNAAAEAVEVFGDDELERFANDEARKRGGGGD